MKSLLITAAIVGAAIAALIIYGTDDSTATERRMSRGADDVGDATEDAYKTMNKHIGRVERKTENAINNVLG